MIIKRLFLPIFLSLVLVNGLLWMIVVPYNQAPDEYSHFDVAEFIAKKNRFPLFSEDENMGVSKYEVPGVVLKYNASYSAMPPLAYLWQALFLKIFGQGQFAYLSARGANLVLALAATLIAYLLSKLLFEKFYQQLAFIVLSVFSSQITFSFAYVNSDAMLLVFSFLLWWWLAKFYKKKVNLKTSLLFGLSLGLAGLTRYNIAPLVLVGTAFYVYKLLKQRNFLKHLALTGFVGGSLAGGWYIRNLVLYQDLLATKQFWEVYYMIYGRHEFINPLRIIFQSNWLWENFKSLWGVFGWNTIYLPNFIYRSLLAFFLLGLIWLLSNLKRLSIKEKSLAKLSFLILLLSFLLSLWQSSFYAFQPQARYIFPAWPGLIYLILLGWQGQLSRLKGPDWQKIFSFIVIIFVVLLNFYSLVGVVIPAYY